LRSAPVIPFNPTHREICPHCNSLATIYVPALAEGHCDACGGSWRFLTDPAGTALDRASRRPQQVAYSDVLGFCVVARRKGWTWREAKDRYNKLGIPAVADETWERAWKEAKDFG
jgi:hypothetical protein